MQGLIVNATSRLEEIVRDLVQQAQGSFQAGGAQRFGIGSGDEKKFEKSILDYRDYKIPDLPDGKVDVDVFRKWRKDSESYLESFKEWKGAAKILHAVRQSDAPVVDTVSFNKAIIVENEKLLDNGKKQIDATNFEFDFKNDTLYWFLPRKLNIELS